MTTIRSAQGHDVTIEPSDVREGHTTIKVGHTYAYPLPRAKLAEAERTLTELAPARDERVIAWEAIVKHVAFQSCYDEDRPLLDAALDRISALLAAEAERDALAATIGRVREAVERNPEPCTETEFTCGWKRAVVDIRAALDPKPTFVLPTEVPARIAVRHRETNTYDELVLWTDGDRQTWWDNEDSSEYTPEQVMSDFTGHRLIDEEA
ncbi:hypothetical protein SPF06_00940 [Sinomonas sp. JGH33]|uniref:Uncharacterized protein n=1 Tax=Sinomonas terricola TaxID=3110330 RepID=A0ABU5T268_9MICC|nr:hypothetical protein [Sinomonas sp. JGH33]MEA5453276.1 hypothetical protein [Sinomonas sp. JGH33]